jgi:hypothetical protein
MQRVYREILFSSSRILWTQIAVALASNFAVRITRVLPSWFEITGRNPQLDRKTLANLFDLYLTHQEQLLLDRR